MSTAAKVIVVILACALVGGVFDALGVTPDAEQRTPSPAPVVAQAKTAKDVARSVYGNAYRDATESDGRILVAFDAWMMTRQSVEGDVSRFMRELMRQGVNFDEATISAYATYTDKATGAKTQQPCFTITFSHGEAAKVVDWSKVDVRLVGLVEYADSALK
jgi:hypothetical protein